MVEKEIVFGSRGDEVPEGIERAVGRLETKVADLEVRLAEAVKARHTCTGESCHVVDDRIEKLTAEIETLKLTAPAPAPPKKKEPSPGYRETVECPECTTALSVPANLAEGATVRCKECQEAFTL